MAGVTTTSYALGDIPAFHDGAGACCGNAGPIGGTGRGTCRIYDEKLEARVLLEAVVCQGGSEKAGALIAGKPVCEGILVAVYIVAAFARMSAVLQRTSVVP